MFCRIDILSRDEARVRVIATRYIAGATAGEIHEAADQACRANEAPGYRVFNVHTADVEEVWN